MIRIRGHIGEMPVELSVELDDEDWARLTTQLRQPLEGEPQVPPAKAPEHDELWHNARQLLSEAGQIEGPQLLAELATLCGSTQAGKRMLVRLRHSAEVQVDSGEQAAVYRWVG